MRVQQGTVEAVSCHGTYAFTKPVRDEIVLVEGIGVAGDVHAGVYVKHRGRVRADPTQPNLRQVHLMQGELFAEVGEKGYRVAAGDLGENVTTSGIDLLGLPLGAILRFGPPHLGPPHLGPAHLGPAHLGPAHLGPPHLGPAHLGLPHLGPPHPVPETEAEADAKAKAEAEGVKAEAEGPDAGVAVGSGWVGGEEQVGDGSAAGADVRGGRADAVGAGPLGAVLAVAAAAALDKPSAASAAAIAAAVGRDAGDDPRPAVIVAGLRNPCGQINGFRDGLLKEVLGRDEEGGLVRKAGIMAVVLRGGPIRPGDAVAVELPPAPHAPLDRV